MKLMLCLHQREALLRVAAAFWTINMQCLGLQDIFG